MGEGERGRDNNRMRGDKLEGEKKSKSLKDKERG